MKRKLLALALAALLACSLLAPSALAAEGEIGCEVLLDGSLLVNVPAQQFSGRGVVQVAAYSVQGRFLDFRSIAIDDLAQGYCATVPAKAQQGGICKTFLLGGEDYQPLAENAWTEVKDSTQPLLVVTKGAAFGTGLGRLSNIWKPGHDDYVGAEPDRDPDGSERLEFYVNGKPATANTANVDAAKGDVAKLYDTDGNGKVDTIYITHYQVVKLTDEIRIQKDADGNNTVMIPGVTSGKYVAANRVSGPYTDLKKGDVVLFYTNDEADADKMAITLEIPEAFTGKVTGIKQIKGQLLIGGSTYDHSAINGAAQGGTSEEKIRCWNDLENEYTFYLDKNGGLAYAVRNTNFAFTVASGVAVVLESKWISDNTADVSSYMQAKLLLASGDVVITQIDRVGMSNNGEVVSCTPTATKTPSVDFVNKYVNYAAITGDSDLNGSLDYTDGFWRYNHYPDGSNEIINLDLETDQWSKTEQLKVTESTVIEPKPAFTEGLMADPYTVFLVEGVGESSGRSVFSRYQGYAEIPRMPAGAVRSVMAVRHRDKTGVERDAVNYVYIKTTGYPLDDLVFLRSDVVIKNAPDDYTIEIVDAKGDVTTMRKDSGLSGMEILKMYTVDAISDDVIISMTEAATNPAKGLYVGTLKDISGGVVAFNEPMTASDGSNATAWGYDDSTVVVLIELKYKNGALAFDCSTVLEGNIEIDTEPTIFETDPKLYVVASESTEGLAGYIYVVRAAKAN